MPGLEQETELVLAQEQEMALVLAWEQKVERASVPLVVSAQVMVAFAGCTSMIAVWVAILAMSLCPAMFVDVIV